MSWCPDFEFRGTQALVDTQSVLTGQSRDSALIVRSDGEWAAKIAQDDELLFGAGGYAEQARSLQYGIDSQLLTVSVSSRRMASAVYQILTRRQTLFTQLQPTSAQQFHQLDADTDGRVTLAELLSYGILSEKKLQDMFGQAGQDATQGVDQAHFSGLGLLFNVIIDTAQLVTTNMAVLAACQNGQDSDLHDVITDIAGDSSRLLSSCAAQTTRQLGMSTANVNDAQAAIDASQNLLDSISAMVGLNVAVVNGDRFDGGDVARIDLSFLSVVAGGYRVLDDTQADGLLAALLTAAQQRGALVEKIRAMLMDKIHTMAAFYNTCLSKIDSQLHQDLQCKRRSFGELHKRAQPRLATRFPCFVF